MSQKEIKDKINKLEKQKSSVKKGTHKYALLNVEIARLYEMLFTKRVR